MDWIAWGVALVLLVTACLHLAWAMGSVWPAKSEPELVRMVVGVENSDQMPARSLTAIVAFGILAAGLVPLMWRGLVSYPHFIPQTLVWLAMWTLAVLFLLRGVMGLLPIFPTQAMPFARLNRLYFSPLIVCIGLGYLILVLRP